METKDGPFRCLAAIAGECSRTWCPEYHEHSLESCNMKDGYCVVDEITMTCTNQPRKISKGRETLCRKCAKCFSKGER